MRHLLRARGALGHGHSGMSASGPTGLAAEEALRHALARVTDRFSRTSAGGGHGPVSSSVFGPDSHPMADLARLAAIWNGTVHSPEADGPPPAGGLPGPALLAVQAERLGLGVTCEQRDLSRLTAADLPCVCVMANGSSRLIIALRDAEDGAPPAFVLATASGERIVPVDAMRAAATGSVFRVRKDSRMAGDPAALVSEPASRISRAGPGSPVGHGADMAHGGGGTVAGFLIFAMRERKPLIIQLVIASVLINVLGLALPLFSMAVFDRVIPHAAFETLWALALGVCLALVLELALRHARLKLFDAVGQSASLSLQGRLIGRLLHARLADVPRNAGGLMHPAQELDGMSQTAPQLIVSLFVDLPFFLVLMVLIGSIAGPVVLAPLIGTVLMVSLHYACHSFAHASHGGHASFMRRQVQAMIDAVGAQERIRVTGSAGQFLSRWERAADEAGFAAHETRYWHGIAAQASATIMQAVVIATLVIGVFQVASASMTIGALSAAMMLVNRAMTPIGIVTGLVFRVMQGLQSAAPVGAILTAEVESGTDGRAGMAGIKGRLDLARVSFTYPGDVRAALADVSFSIQPGERVGLIGKAGCGKSTLLKIIARLHEPGSGRLSLDQRDIRQFDPAALRRVISCMPQDTQLVDGSLEDNLTLGLGTVPRSEIERVAAISGVHDFAGQHPSGYSLQVGAGGGKLSGGERQCVALARALMGSPRILMLDEPTSALDNALEARIIAGLKAELASGTMATSGLILATHRLQVLALVDRIIWLEGGRVVADGPKEEVFRKFGLAV
jgi:ATP-binding cassette, subfamily C, bacterial LapB